MNKKFKLTILILIILFMSACKNKSSDLEEITVAAAVSLLDVTTELKKLYESKNLNSKLLFTYAGSGTLQNQIEQGAPIDVFISASQKQIENLNKKDLLMKDSIKYIAENEIVLITSNKSEKNIESFYDLIKDDINSIAIGDISSVPAGQYAYDILNKMNIFDKISSKLIYGTDVRQILTWVEQSQTDFGIVYATDAFISDYVKIAAYADKEFAPQVLYTCAVIKESKKIEEANKFIEFLKSEEALEIFEKYGFKRAD